MLRSFGVFALAAFAVLSIQSCTAPDAILVGVQEFQNTRPLIDAASSVKLASGDMIELSIEVDGRSEVPLHRATVNPMGYVTLPLIGDVQVEGLGIDAARQEVSQRYSNYYVSKPVIVLTLVGDDESAGWGVVTVVGRVVNPGPVALSAASGMRLSGVIQAAGGFATSAKASEIQVTRIDRRGRKIRVVVNFSEIGKSGNADADIMLMNGDIVNVPERYW